LAKTGGGVVYQLAELHAWSMLLRGGGGSGNVKALHAVKDPLTPAAMRVNVKNNNKTRRKATCAMSFVLFSLRLSACRWRDATPRLFHAFISAKARF
jgi:hypothetical protein